MSLFNVNYGRLVKALLFRPLRQPKMLAWMMAVVAPVQHLHARFLAFRNATLYDLAHNGQVCKLEGLLNDAFDNAQRRIYIADTTPASPLWIRKRSEAQPVFIRRRSETVVQPAYKKYLYTRSELDYGLDFTVWVPFGLAYDAARMQALVNKYRIPSSVFTIKRF